MFGRKKKEKKEKEPEVLTMKTANVVDEQEPSKPVVYEEKGIEQKPEPNPVVDKKEDKEEITMLDYLNYLANKLVDLDTKLDKVVENQLQLTNLALKEM